MSEVRYLLRLLSFSLSFVKYLLPFKNFIHVYTLHSTSYTSTDVRKRTHVSKCFFSRKIFYV